MGVRLCDLSHLFKRRRHSGLRQQDSTRRCFCLQTPEPFSPLATVRPAAQQTTCHSVRIWISFMGHNRKRDGPTAVQLFQAPMPGTGRKDGRALSAIRGAVLVIPALPVPLTGSVYRRLLSLCPAAVSQVHEPGANTESSDGRIPA